MLSRTLAAGMIAIALAVPTTAPPLTTELTYPSSDDTTIHADVYLPASGAEPAADDPLAPAADITPPKALVLAFHMAGAAARGEYAGFTAPRLVENGYAVLTPDLRLGGERLGTNRTVAALEAEGIPELESYCDAYPDVLATLDFAENWLAEHFPEATGEDAIPIVALGSSYTATLVMRLAAEEGDRLAGVVSCSPAAGDPMDGCQPEDFYEKITVPRMVLIPEREINNQTKRRFLTNCRVLGFRIHIEPGGVHGSLLLDPERNTDRSAETAWRKLLDFLGRATE